MRWRTPIVLTLAILMVGCTDGLVEPPEPTVDDAVSGALFDVDSNPTDRDCRADITSGIASTWHDYFETDPPPPGAVKLWIETYGHLFGIESVRDLQNWWCET